jgi:hypothetical protein
VHPGDAAGALIPAGQPAALAQALMVTLTRVWDELSLAALVEPFGWPRNASAVIRALRGGGTA